MKEVKILTEILLIIIGIITIINFIDIRNIKKENLFLKRQNRIAMETIEFLKRKINNEPLPDIITDSVNKEQKINNKPIKSPILKERTKKEKTNLENVLGKNIIGFIAAILIFIGIIAFGALIFNKITDQIKVLLMVFGSFGMLGLGYFLSIKKKNAFTLSLTGCGSGALFITIFIAHIYFGLINDILAFGLVLIWALGMFFLSRKIDSKLLIYITHIGCIISSILAIGYGQIETKMFEITVYQVLVSVLLLMEDIKNSPLMFKISGWATMIMNTILIVYCYNTTWYNNVYINDVLQPAPLGTNVFIISIILLILNTVSYVLTLKSINKYEILESLLSNIIYFISILTGPILVINMFVERLLYPNATIYEYIENEVYYWFVNTLPIFIGAFITVICLFAIKKLVRNKTVITCTNISFLSFLAFILCVRVFNTSNGAIPFISILGLIALYKYYKTKENIYFIFGNIFIGIDAFMICNLLEQKTFMIVIALIYAIILFGTLVIAGYIKKDFFYFPVLYYALINSVLLACGIELFNNEFVVLIFITIANILFTLINQYYVKIPTAKLKKISNFLISAGEIIYILILSVIVGNESFKIESLLLSILLFVYGLCKIKTLISSKNKFLGAWYGIKFTWLTIVPIITFTSLMDEQLILSIVCMFIALLCILFGFNFNVKSTRVYGLVLILASVLKIVVIDMWGQDSIIRVVSLIIGGIICFVISAGYNYFEKNKILPAQDKENNSMNSST